MWNSTYNYTNLYEIPTGIVIDNSGNIIVSGASASSFNNWDYAVVEYDSTGIEQNVYRQNATLITFDRNPPSYQSFFLSIPLNIGRQIHLYREILSGQIAIRHNFHGFLFGGHLRFYF